MICCQDGCFMAFAKGALPEEYLRVVPSRIPNLERGQYEDFGFVRAKRQRNVASKSTNLRNVWKEPCTGCGFVTFVTFLRFSDILGFAKKTKNTYRLTKT